MGYVLLLFSKNGFNFAVLQASGNIPEEIDRLHNWVIGVVNNCGALRDLLPFVQFKEREKHPWRCVTFSKVACVRLQLKVTLLHGCFSRF